MPSRTSLIIGSAHGCDLLVQGNGVGPRHAELRWRDGLVLQDLGQGRTTVDGRVLGPNEAVPLQGFHANVMVGDARVPLTSPEISKLFLDRTAVPSAAPGQVVVGRDPSRANVVVSHPTVSSLHLRVDLQSRTLTDLGSKSGTFDRNSQRLPANAPVPIDMAGGYSLGAVWIPSQVLLEMAGAPAGAGAPMAQGMALRVHTLEAGDELGWSSVLSGRGKFYQARALEPVEVIKFDGHVLLEKCRSDNSFGYKIMHRLVGVVSERLQAARMQVLDMYSPIAKKAGA